jgi:hypothetical protein
MGGGSDCIVGKITAGRNCLRMTDSGSMGTESSSPRHTDLKKRADLQSTSEPRSSQRSGASVDQCIKADVYLQALFRDALPYTLRSGYALSTLVNIKSGVQFDSHQR